MRVPKVTSSRITGPARSLRARLVAPHAAKKLAGECEAFLRGAYAEHAVREGAVVPAWALLNTVAHGDLARIRAAARPAGWRWSLPVAWARAARELAFEVIELVDGDEDLLEAIQLAVLIPVELEFIETHGTDTDVGAAIASARAALHSASS